MAKNLFREYQSFEFPAKTQFRERTVAMGNLSNHHENQGGPSGNFIGVLLWSHLVKNPGKVCGHMG